MKHFEFTDETLFVAPNKMLHRIRATMSFDEIENGEIGGWVEKETNLMDFAWVRDEAKVFDNAVVAGHARVCEFAKVCGSARVEHHVCVRGDAYVADYCRIGDYAIIGGHAQIIQSATIGGHVMVGGHVCITRYCTVYGNEHFMGDALIATDCDFCSFNNLGYRCDTTTAYKGKDGDVQVTCRGFFGTLDEFAAMVERMYGDNRQGETYKAIMVIIRLKFYI